MDGGRSSLAVDHRHRPATLCLAEQLSQMLSYLVSHLHVAVSPVHKTSAGQLLLLHCFDELAKLLHAAPFDLFSRVRHTAAIHMLFLLQDSCTDSAASE